MTREELIALIVAKIQACAGWSEDWKGGIPSDECLEVDGDVPVGDIADAIILAFSAPARA
jgi:hypothetical protein